MVDPRLTKLEPTPLEAIIESIPYCIGGPFLLVAAHCFKIIFHVPSSTAINVPVRVEAFETAASTVNIQGKSKFILNFRMQKKNTARMCVWTGVNGRSKDALQIATGDSSCWRRLWSTEQLLAIFLPAPLRRGGHQKLIFLRSSTLKWLSSSKHNLGCRCNSL